MPSSLCNVHYLRPTPLLQLLAGSSGSLVLSWCFACKREVPVTFELLINLNSSLSMQPRNQGSTLPPLCQPAASRCCAVFYQDSLNPNAKETHGCKRTPLINSLCVEILQVMSTLYQFHFSEDRRSQVILSEQIVVPMTEFVNWLSQE